MHNKQRMANPFDNRLPKTTTYWTEGQIFFIKNTSFFFNKEETEATVELLVFAMKDQFTKGIVINNREAKGVWPQAIVNLFENNGESGNEIRNKKMATLTNDALKSMQTNRLSREHGIYDTSRTFSTEFNDEVKSFLLS